MEGDIGAAQACWMPEQMLSQETALLLVEAEAGRGCDVSFRLCSSTSLFNAPGEKTELLEIFLKNCKCTAFNSI